MVIAKSWHKFFAAGERVQGLSMWHIQLFVLFSILNFGWQTQNFFDV